MISIQSSSSSGSLRHGTPDRTPRQALQAGDSPSASSCPSPEAITGRSHISFSQVSCYQSCPKAFEFKYVLRADPAFVSSSLIFGTAFHEAVAQTSQADLEGAPRPSVVELAATVGQQLRAPSVPLQLARGESLESLNALASRMLTAYLASPESHVHGTSICIEDVVRGVVDPSVPVVEARVDHVYQRPDGSLVIRDVKTTRIKWSEDKVAESSPQLQLYAMLLDRELVGLGKVEALEFLTVTKAAKPVVRLHQVPVAKDGCRNLVDQLRQVWHGIHSGVFPARPGWPCKTCPFNDRCPATIKPSGAFDAP